MCILFWNIGPERQPFNRWTWLCWGELEGKKGKKIEEKKGTSEGLRGGFGQSFPTVPTRGSSGGVDWESISPVINTGVICRLLIICYFQCVWEHCRPNHRKSAWKLRLPQRQRRRRFFFLSSFFFIRDFFFLFFYFHSARWAGSEEWRRRQRGCLCLPSDELVQHMKTRASL